jgi:hypothetical protein
MDLAGNANFKVYTIYLMVNIFAKLFTIELTHVIAGLCTHSVIARR